VPLRRRRYAKSNTAVGAGMLDKFAPRETLGHVFKGVALPIVIDSQTLSAAS